MLRTVDTVREREREREHNSNELGFVCYTQNTVVVSNKNVCKIEINIDVKNHKKDGIYDNEKLPYTLSFLWPFFIVLRL